jgi:hypothetical protein
MPPHNPPEDLTRHFPPQIPPHRGTGFARTHRKNRFPTMPGSLTQNAHDFPRRHGSIRIDKREHFRSPGPIPRRIDRTSLSQIHRIQLRRLHIPKPPPLLFAIVSQPRTLGVPGSIIDCPDHHRQP